MASAYSIAKEVRMATAMTNRKLMALVFLNEPEGVLGADDEDVLDMFPTKAEATTQDVFVPLDTKKSGE
jgi:hypothetical protein